MLVAHEIVTKQPGECTASEFKKILALVIAGGEVAAGGLENRARQAELFALLSSNKEIVGIAALKNPAAAYRAYVSTASGASLVRSSLPYELGWVYVSPQYRGVGYAQELCLRLINSAGPFGLFATSNTENASMHHVLFKLGFVGAGTPYRSRRGEHQLQVFIKPAT